jgi:preprotein translocase subunit YajC
MRNRRRQAEHTYRKDAPVQGNTELTALTHVAAAKSGSNPLVTLLPVILIGVVFYFLLFRPQRRRQQQQAKMQGMIQPGQRVMTTAGMLATVVAVEDDGVVLEIAPGVEARFVKQAIGQVLDDSTEEEADEEETAETEEVPETRETLQDDVEAKTETLPGAAGQKPEEEPLKDGEKKPGKGPSA